MDEHSYRIVLCEDEPLLLERLRRMVEGLDSGFTVVGMAENGREALTALNETGADLLITDIRMPVMDGIELIKKLQEEQPRLECMLISGYGDFEYARTALRLGVCELLYRQDIPFLFHDRFNPKGAQIPGDTNSSLHGKLFHLEIVMHVIDQYGDRSQTGEKKFFPIKMQHDKKPPPELHFF
jgi:CheY-like chemotaxis protein